MTPMTEPNKDSIKDKSLNSNDCLRQSNRKK